MTNTARCGPPSTAEPAGAVAVLGIGIMGSGMARNLAAAGLPTTVWDRSPEVAAPLAGDDLTAIAGAPLAADDPDGFETDLTGQGPVRSRGLPDQLRPHRGTVGGVTPPQSTHRDNYDT